MIEVVDNGGPTDMRQKLTGSVNEASQIDMGTAFVDNAGLMEVLPAVRDALNRGVDVRFLTHMSKDPFNEPAALRKLLRLQNRYGRHFQTRISRLKGEFHQKVYLFKSKRGKTTYVGSSNLTLKGLTRGAELNLRVTGRDAISVFTQVRDIFDEQWDNAEQLDKGLLNTYAEYYARKHITTRTDERAGRLWHKLAGALGKREPPSPRAVKHWITWVELYFNEETEKAIEGHCPTWSDYTDLDRREYNKVKRRDILLIADYRGEQPTLARTRERVPLTLSANVIVGKRRIETDEGMYFVGFKPVSRTMRVKITETLIRRLRGRGVVGAKKKTLKYRMKWLGPRQTRELAQSLEWKLPA
jgi:HKD family nuclease